MARRLRATSPRRSATRSTSPRRCDFEFKFSSYQFPVYQVPDGRDARGRRCERGRAQRPRRAPERAPARSDSDRRRRGARYERAPRLELGVITQMGFAGYFLIVADFINWAKDAGHPGRPGPRLGGRQPGRLGAPHHRPRPDRARPALRALPQSRAQVDARHRRRLLLRAPRRGDPLRAREVRRRPRRADHHLRHAQGEAGHQGRRPRARLHLRRDRSHREALSGAEAGQGLPARARRSRWSRGCASCATAASARSGSSTCALRLEGLLRHASKHAAGIVIAPQPLTEDVPLWVDKDGAVVTQYTFGDVEEIGLIKFDFLGLKTLTLIDEHRAPHPRRARRRPSTSSQLPLDDEATYKLLAAGDTVGVFQMESGGMRRMLDAAPPDAASTTWSPCSRSSAPARSTARHGRRTFIKRKHGKEPIKLPHPALEPILRETYGVIVYQEQVMQIAQALAGYSLGDADNLRRAMGKKKVGGDGEGARALPRRGVARRTASPKAGRRDLRPDGDLRRLRLQQEPLRRLRADHYQTAYLKAHYPDGVHGRAAVARDGRHRQHLQEHRRVPRRAASRILPPDVNESREDFTVAGGAIRFGLGAVKGVGSKAIESILAARAGRPVHRASHDFCLRVRGQQVNRRVLESLIKCGAFDSIERNRARLLAGARRRCCAGRRCAAGARRARRSVSSPAATAARRCAAAGAARDRAVERRGGAAARARDARLLHHRASARSLREGSAPLHQRHGGDAADARPGAAAVPVARRTPGRTAPGPARRRDPHRPAAQLARRATATPRSCSRTRRAWSR